MTWNLENDLRAINDQGNFTKMIELVEHYDKFKVALRVAMVKRRALKTVHNSPMLGGVMGGILGGLVAGGVCYCFNLHTITFSDLASPENWALLQDKIYNISLSLFSND